MIADFAYVVADRAPDLYQDPVRFSRNTHPAALLKKVVTTIFGHLAGPNEAGAAVRLSTGFGAGKTHSLIAEEGWQAGSKLRLLEAKSKEPADLKIGKRKYVADLIPPTLIVARYFAAEQQAVEELEAEQEAIAQRIAEMEEEHGCEEGLREEVKNDKGNITKGSVTARLKEVAHDPEADDERRPLTWPNSRVSHS